MAKHHRKYTQEFKEQAVALSCEVGGNKAAKQLGVSASNLHAWRGKVQGSRS